MGHVLSVCYDMSRHISISDWIIVHALLILPRSGDQLSHLTVQCSRPCQYRHATCLPLTAVRSE
jgi:hypothetical protein